MMFSVRKDSPEISSFFDLNWIFRRSVYASIWPMAAVFLACLGGSARLALAGASRPQYTISSGCSEKTFKTGTFTLTTTDGNKKTRSYLIQVPASYTPSQAYALVFVFHGAGGSSAQAQSWGLQNATGAAESSIFIFPQGIAYLNYGIGWDDATNSYDFPFFDNMVDNTESAYCIDTSRVLVAGFSWGGDFSTALACNRGSVIRAVEANSTDDEFKNKVDYSTYQGLPCPTTKHPPVRFEHAANGDSAYPAPLFHTTSQLFQFLNFCSAASLPVSPATSVESCVSYNDCESKLVECTFSESLGHVLPPNWAQNTWNFFSAFPSSLTAPSN